MTTWRAESATTGVSLPAYPHGFIMRLVYEPPATLPHTGDSTDYPGEHAAATRRPLWAATLANPALR
jgi:hypothetical protein